MRFLAGAQQVGSVGVFIAGAGAGEGAGETMAIAMGMGTDGGSLIHAG
jgi:hypothetical protein